MKVINIEENLKAFTWMVDDNNERMMALKAMGIDFMAKRSQAISSFDSYSE